MESDTLPPPNVFFRPADVSALIEITALETVSYPADEATSPANLAFRLKNAPDFFLTAVSAVDNSNDALQVVGFVCATLTTAASLTHESMGAHEPEGTMLCIHSVVVAEHSRRKKIGSRLLTAYVNYVSMARPDVESMRLLCKEYLVDFYKGAGFNVVGPSPVVHGNDPWVEMVLDLHHEEEEEEEES